VIKSAYNLKEGDATMFQLKRHKKILYSIIAFIGVFCLLWGNFFSGYALLSNLQYRSATSDMKPVEATVVDITGEHEKSSDWHIARWIHVTYEVDGVTYDEELRMIVRRLIKAKTDIDCSVGDQITIFYEPEDPNVIVYPNDERRETFYNIIGLGCVALIAVIDFSFDRYYASKKGKKVGST
jgi:hypothetical protein